MSRAYRMMACGHVNNALCGDGPACAICGCTTPLREVSGTDGLEGRRAKCSCGKEIDSRWELPFFKYMPDKPFDEYYCGCWGWD